MMKRAMLASLRKSRHKTQVDVATAMRVSQSAVSKIESRRDVSLAALRDYIEALGGELQIAAKFRDGVVPISTREVRYGARAPLRRVAERAATTAPAKAIEPVVAPEWLDEVDRIRAMKPAARLQELANGAAFFALATRRG